MGRTFARLACSAALAVCVALMLPAGAPAFQEVVLEQGGTVLRITGDQGKASDEVTIAYDSVNDEYVLTHDIVFFPFGCTPVGSGPPFKIVRCPAKGIRHIVVDLGADTDIFSLIGFSIDDLSAGGTWIPPDLVDVDVNMGSGNDKVEESGIQAPTLPAVGVRNPATRKIDMGGGGDAATVGGGINTIVFGDGNGKLVAGNGQNRVIVGKGNSKIELGDGTDDVTVGDGNSKVTVGDGTNTVVFGAGTGIFTGGAGPDTATFGTGNGVFTGRGGKDNAFFGLGDNTFSGGTGADYATTGPGNDKFTGGPGNDKAKLGSGDDKAFGGSGRDRLFGNSGGDHLYGGPDFDLLNGGAGGFDKCLGGAGGAKPVGCEVGYQYGH